MKTVPEITWALIIYSFSEWKSGRYTLIGDWSALLIWKWSIGDSVSMKTVPEFAWALIYALFWSGSLESIP